MNAAHYQDELTATTRAAKPGVGRPRRGTETARSTALLDAATRVFLQEGYGFASMDKIAAASGASTRTLYERYRNKAELLGAVINRLVERLATVLATAELDRLEPRAALTVIADTLIARVSDPDSAALFRIMATESHRFPELAAKMRASDRRCVDNVVAAYFRGQVARGTLALNDPDKAASLFLQMICSEMRERLLFSDGLSPADLDMKQHAAAVVDIFLLGAAPR